MALVVLQSLHPAGTFALAGSIFKLTKRAASSANYYVQGQSPSPGAREYFYYIDHQGMLFLDDARMKNFTSCFKEKNFLKFFFGRLKKNDSGRYPDFRYLSPCGRERNYVRCDDLPVVFTNVIDNDKGSTASLAYGHAGELLSVPFQPDGICMVPESGRVYHPAPTRLGGVGLISDKLSMLWTSEKRFLFENGEEKPPTKFLWLDFQEVPLNNQLLDLIGEEQQRR